MIPLVLGYGYLEGRWTHRWQPSRQLERAAGRLDKLPLHVGNWEGEEHQLDPRQVAKGEISGYKMRHYTQRTTGKAVSMLLVCGRPGPMSLHTPEVCYPGAGFRQQDEPRREKIAGTAEFWVARFHKPDAPDPEALRIYWGWTTGGTWKAPDHPRLAFASAPGLYKLYVIEPLHPLQEKQEYLAPEFLKDLLPELERHLFSGAATSRQAQVSGKP
jgi:hypothetical protein